MKIVTLKKQFEPRLKTKTSVSGTELVIEDTTAFFDADTEKFIGAYIKNFCSNKQFGDFFNDFNYNKSSRLSGLISKSQIFGFAPRDYLKNLTCRRCVFDVNHPKANQVLSSLNLNISKFFKERFPNQHALQNAALNRISDNWKFKETVFTSGIINLDTQYLYHTDNGNLESCISGMLTFKNEVEGGYLHLPEYNALIKNEGGSLLLFNGAEVAHGVTEFIKKRPNSYRITIVFYALEALKNCCNSFEEEVAHFNRIKTK